MSRRNTYLLGGIAVAAGIVMIAVSIAALSGEETDEPAGAGGRGETTAPRSPAQPRTTPAERPPAKRGRAPRGVKARGLGVGRQLSRRRAVRAPAFTAELISKGAVPEPLAGVFERASQAGTLEMQALRGAPVVLHLWSSECAPCRADARLVEATWKRWAPRGVMFVGVSVNERRETSARTVIRQYGLSYPAISDRSSRIARAYGATALPQTFFVTARGDIVGEVVGSPSVRQLESGVEAARSGTPFGSEQGGARVPLR